MAEEIPDEVLDACFDAAEEGNVDAVQKTMDAHPVLWDDHRFVLGVIEEAAKGGHLKVLRLYEKQLQANVIVEDTSLLNECLGSAAKHGHLNVVEYLLAQGADANADGTSVKGFTSLYRAIEKGHFEIAECLLASGAEYPVEKIESNLLLHAADSGDLALVTWLLEHQHDPHVVYRSSNGLLCNVFSFAPESEDDPITKLLLDAGCKLPVEGLDQPILDYAAKLYQPVREESEFRAYFDAIRADDEVTVREFRNRNIFLWEKGDFGMDAWDCAARSGHVNVGRAIMDRDKSVDFPAVNLHRFGVVLTAIRQGHIPFAEMMIENVCKFRTHAVQFNPIFVAITSRQHGTLQWLLTQEVDSHLEYRFTDGRRMNAFTYAQEQGDATSVEILSAAGCQPPKKWSLKKQELDEDSDETMLSITPQIQCALALHDRQPEQALSLLHENPVLSDDTDFKQNLIKFAASTGQASFMRALEESIRESDSLITEWLYAATRGGHIEVIKFLADCGADLAYDNDGSFPPSAMRTAVGNGHLDIAQFFHRNGVSLSTATIKDNILFEAMGQERADIVRWLLSTDLDPHVTYQTSSGKLINALAYAEANDHRAVIKMLKAAGCTLPTEEAGN